MSAQGWETLVRHPRDGWLPSGFEGKGVGSSVDTQNRP